MDTNTVRCLVCDSLINELKVRQDGLKVYVCQWGHETLWEAYYPRCWTANAMKGITRRSCSVSGCGLMAKLTYVTHPAGHPSIGEYHCANNHLTMGHYWEEEPTPMISGRKAIVVNVSIKESGIVEYGSLKEAREAARRRATDSPHNEYVVYAPVSSFKRVDVPETPINIDLGDGKIGNVGF
jgi:hypothetical protein